MGHFPLRPPLLPMPRNLGWVLNRAFGPVDGVLACPDPSSVVQLASRLSLAPRIGGRLPPERLAAEVGEDTAAEFRRRYRLTAAAAVLKQDLCGALGKRAEEIQAPLVFLKGAALNLPGSVPIGLRESSDIDVLLPVGKAEEFSQCLSGEGWTSEDVPLGEQHLTPLLHPGGMGLVEVHWRLTGLRVSGREPASYGDLEAQGLLFPVDTFPGNCYRLSDEAQIAHLVTHALGQHLWFPGSYPQLRFLADMVDLGVDEELRSEFRDGGYRWIEEDVREDVFAAAMDLLSLFTRGENAEDVWNGHSPPSLYLRHILLGVDDPRYLQSIRFRSVSRGLRQPGERGRAVLGLLKTSLWLTRGQVDQLYGKPRGRLGYLGWRLFRPFDVILRLVRYGFSWISVRLARIAGPDRG